MNMLDNLMMTRNMKTTKNDRNYYCSYKFKFLKIDAETFTTYNCHAASPHSIDFEWLKQNPGRLFNNQTSLSERQMMLRNERNSSCEPNCWSAEDVGGVSPRIVQQGYHKTHEIVDTKPEVIDLTLNSDCNLTCSYCCREFSNAWRQDLLSHGSYNVQDPDRYKITDSDKVRLKLGQKGKKQSNKYQLLLDEVKLNSSNLKELVITGGEPFLDNDLYRTLIDFDLPIESQKIIYTGLGVNLKRFGKIVEQLREIPNIRIRISAENTGKFLEFNRYGLRCQDAVEKIKLLDQYQVEYEFHSTITNLSIFDFVNFYKNTVGSKNCILTFGYSPRFLAPFVLDNSSKNQIKSDIGILPEDFQEKIINAISHSPEEQDKVDCKNFLLEFCRRRKDLNLNIFPKTFLEWLNITDVV